MQKSGFISEEFRTDKQIQLENISSLTISNYGDTPLTVTISSVSRIVPPLKEEIGVPFGSFNLPGDGTACDIKLEMNFENGTGRAILDYRKVQTKTC